MYSDAGIVDQSSKLYEVLFKGTEMIGDGSPSSVVGGKAYWLASSGVTMYGSSFCGFGPGAVYGSLAYTGGDLFSSNGNSFACWLAGRPVVYLQSGVTVEDLSISSSGTEENWTTTLPYDYSGKKLEFGQITE